MWCRQAIEWTQDATAISFALKIHRRPAVCTSCPARREYLEYRGIITGNLGSGLLCPQFLCPVTTKTQPEEIASLIWRQECDRAREKGRDRAKIKPYTIVGCDQLTSLETNQQNWGILQCLRVQDCLKNTLKHIREGDQEDEAQNKNVSFDP